MDELIRRVRGRDRPGADRRLGLVRLPDMELGAAGGTGKGGRGGTAVAFGRVPAQLRRALSRRHRHDRETHIKQLEFPAPGAAPSGARREPVKIVIRPALSTEPLATHYAAQRRLPVCAKHAGRDLRGRGTERPASANIDRTRHRRARGRARHDEGAARRRMAAVSHDLGMAPPVATLPRAAGPANPRPIARRFSAGRKARVPIATWAVMCG